MTYNKSKSLTTFRCTNDEYLWDNFENIPGFVLNPEHFGVVGGKFEFDSFKPKECSAWLKENYVNYEVKK